MKNLSVTWRTTLGSFVLVALFLSVSGAITNNLLTGLNKSSAHTTLQGEIDLISGSIESVDPQSIEDPFDPLPPGQLGFVTSPSKGIVLNSLEKFTAAEVVALQNSKENTLFHFDSSIGKFWFMHASVEGPGGKWEIIVAQNNDFGAQFTERTRGLLLLMGFLLLILSVIGAWVLAKFILRPVTNLQQKADFLLAEDRHDLLPVPQANDELSRLALTLNEMLVKLYDSVGRERRLVEDVSHELRSPLALLQSRIQLLIRDREFLDIEAELQSLFRTSKQMSSLVDNLLFMARQETQEGSEQISASVASLVVATTVDNTRLVAANKNINISYTTSVVSKIKVSEEGFERILRNLLSNSLAGVNQNGKIHASLEEIGSNAVLIIEDDGSGFDEDFIPIAFQRFSRQDSSRSRDTGGSGIGLALVKSIADTYDASISIVNREDRGSAVTVTFKLGNH